MDEADLARFVEEQLLTLARAKDRSGLAIMLPADEQIAVLAATITAVNNRRADLKLFEAWYATDHLAGDLEKLVRKD